MNPLFNSISRYAILIIAILSVVTASFFTTYGNYDLNAVLHVLDKYLSILLTSWPSVVLLLGLLTLLTQRGAIDALIRSIETISTKGVSTRESAAVTQQKEQVEEVKNLKEKKEALTVEPVVADTVQITEDEVERLREEKASLENKLKEEVRSRFFERTYNAIFGSQLNILVSLITREKMTYTEAAEFYNQVAKNYPAISTYSVDSYFNFLFSSGLIRREIVENTDLVFITELGKEFVNFIKSQNLSFSRVF